MAKKQTNEIEEVVNEEVEINEVATEEVVVEEVVNEEVAKTPKKYLVETPVENYHGEVAGVHFAYGKAEVYEGHILNWFKKKGYKITAL